MIIWMISMILKFVLTSLLKFHPVAVEAKWNFVFTMAHQDVLDEAFDSGIKDSGDEECIVLG